MKIFSNFDTGFKKKVVNKKLKSFQKSEVIVITRSKYYFIFRVFLPFWFLLWLGFLGLMFLERYSISWYISVSLICVWILVIWFQIIHRFLKFRYDFTVVDPLGVTTYKQKWILRSFLKQIPAKRIRSIQICRNTFLENIFEFGSVDLLTDFTDNMHIGEEDEAASVIGLTYVDNPYKIESKITDLCFK